MLTPPILVALVFALIALVLSSRRGTRWAGQLIGSAITAFAALICWAGSVLTLDAPAAGPTTSRNLSIVGGALTVLSLVLLGAGIWGITAMWRRRRLRRA